MNDYRVGHIKKGVQRFQPEPGSLAARAARDRSLRQRIKEGRRRATADNAVVEGWARTGFVSRPSKED